MDIFKSSTQSQYTFADLFAGAGGFSLGLRSAGLTELFALEIDSWACDTLRANAKAHTKVIEADIQTITEAQIRELPRPDIIVGGPPCQGFSVAGPSQFGVDDPRNNLFLHYLRFVELLRPSICIIENVPGITTKIIKFGATAADVMCDYFKKLGYSTQIHLLNAADYGVPQSRRRAFIVATAENVCWTTPENTHSAQFDQASLFGSERSCYVTVSEAIGDLPSLDSGEGTDELIPYGLGASNQYQELMRVNSEGVSNHIAMNHSSRLIERFKTIQHGQSLKDVEAEHGQKRKFSGEINETPFKSNNQRLNPNLPCLAIPASFQSTFLHPFKHRNLTAREAARLMSFPDNYIFKGKRTTMSWEKHLSQYNQIGNAVCPLMAQALGRSCVKALSVIKGKPDLIVDGRPSIIDVEMKSTVHKTISNNRFLEYKELFDKMNDVGISIVSDKYNVTDGMIRHNEVSIPCYYIPLALIIPTIQKCKLCNPKISPHSNHTGFMPYLISKSAVDSLLKKHKDNGLDYHLRVLDNRPNQCAHYVGKILESYGYAKQIADINPRTGRNVTGLVVVDIPDRVEKLRDDIVTLLENIMC